MNDLQVFDNPEFGENDLEKMRVELDRFALLASACEVAEDGDFKKANSILQLASVLFHPTNDNVFNTLYSAVRINIAWMKKPKGKYGKRGSTHE